MASANVVFGKVSGGLPLADALTLTSELVASTGVSAAAPDGTSTVRVTPVGGAMYVAFSTGTPAPASNPRVYAADGQPIEMACPVGTKVGVVDA